MSIGIAALGILPAAGGSAHAERTDVPLTRVGPGYGASVTVPNPTTADRVPAPSGLAGIKAVRHAYGPDRAHWLTVYRPSTGRPNGRTAFWIHGGSWLFGSPDAIGSAGPDNDMPALMDLVRRGWTVIGVNYRTTSPTVHVEQINQDVLAALSWGRTRLGATPASTVIIGQSAGAYQALVAGSQRTPVVAGWVAVELPSDFASLNRLVFRYGDDVIRGATTVATMLDCPIVGVLAQCSKDRWHSTNGATLITSARQVRPAYVIESMADAIVPVVEHSDPVVAALIRRRASVKVDIIEAGGHNSANRRLNYTALRNWMTSVTTPAPI